MASLAGQLRRSQSVLPVPPAEDQSKERILLCLTRLNDKATQRLAAEDLALIVRVCVGGSPDRSVHANMMAKTKTQPRRHTQDLDVVGLSTLVNSICTAGAWEPKPFAKKVHMSGTTIVHWWPVHGSPPCS
jgi:hypothetical protein